MVGEVGKVRVVPEPSSPGFSDDSMSLSAKSKSYYLLWSKNSIRNTMIWTASLFFLPRFFPSIGSFLDQMNPFLASHTVGCGDGKHEIWKVITLPLLSSACCGIQLIVNAVLSYGCIGFNKWLGPLRPGFISFMIYSTVTSFLSIKLMGTPAFSVGNWILKVSLSWFIALMPEIVHFWNNWSAQIWKKSKNPSDYENEIKSINSMAPSTTTVLSFDIPSMGCVACINSVTDSIRRAASSPDNILDASSWLQDPPAKGGKARVVVKTRSDEETGLLAEAIVKSIRNSGFTDCKAIPVSQEDDAVFNRKQILGF